MFSSACSDRNGDDQAAKGQTSAPTAAETDDDTCLASGVQRPDPQSELPTAVAEQRDAVSTAALACHSDALAALAIPSFTASLGGGGPIETWTAAENERPSGFFTTMMTSMASLSSAGIPADYCSFGSWFVEFIGEVVTEDRAGQTGRNLGLHHVEEGANLRWGDGDTVVEEAFEARRMEHRVQRAHVQRQAKN